MSFIRTRTLVSLATIALAALVVATLAGSAASATREAPLTAHLLRAGELRGFVPNGAPEVVREPLAWAAQTAPGHAAEEAAALRRSGFVAAASVHLRSSGRDDREALSYAVEFRTAQAARAYVARTMKRLSVAVKGERVALLCAIQPLGALRLDVSSRGSVGHNLLFQRGRVAHLVGAGYAPDAVDPPSALWLAAAASALLRRVDLRRP